MAFLDCIAFGFNSTTSGIEVSTWNGTGASWDSTGGSLATGALKILTPATGVRTGIAHQFRSSAPNEIFVGFYLKVTTRPDVRTTIALLCSGTSLSTDALTPQGAIELDTDGTLVLVNWQSGSRATVGSASSALTNGTRYWIELHQEQAAGTNTIQGRIDESQFAGSTSLSLSTDAKVIRLGANMHAEACTSGQWEISDAVIYDATASTQNTYPGAASLGFCLPDAAGDFAEGAVGGSAPAATAWQSFTDNPPDDDVTYWELQTDSSANASSADRVDVSIAALPVASNTPTSIEWIAVGARVKPLTSATCSWVPRIKGQASGTVSEGTTVSITGTAWGTHDDTSTSRNYKLCRTTNPQSSSAWAASDIANVQIGARAPDGNPNVDITSLWAVVRHVPGAGGGGTTPKNVFGKMLSGPFGGPV